MQTGMEPSRTEGHQTASQVAEGNQAASQVATDACEEKLDPYPFKEPRDQLQAIYPFYRRRSTTDSNRLSDPGEEVVSSEGKRKQQNVDKK